MNSKIIAKNIVNWLKNYSLKSNTNGYVVGISGGVDSAITSTLCAKTGLPVLCLDLPIFQSKEEQNRAIKHIEWLKENLRMTTLYYFASLNNSLVTGTGNKVEDFGIGFYTKYGDGGVDISPIADLYKTEVFAIAKELDIINDIIIAKPTDGLWDDDRTDEDQIGASYEELEWAMKEKDFGNKSFEYSGRKKEIFEILNNFNKQNLHKMNPIPIYLVPDELR